MPARHLIALFVLACVIGCGEESVVVTELSTDGDATSLSLSWRISRPGFSRAALWEAGHPEKRRESPAREAPAVEHAATFTGLTPETEYVFTVFADAFTAPEGHVKTPPEIGIADVTVSASPTTAQVTWRTKRPTDSSVRYGRTEELEDAKADATQKAVLDHAVQLAGLDPGQTYHLRVVATDAAGVAPKARSPVVSFTTPARADERIARIMPRPKPHANTLANLSRDYLKRLHQVSAAERKAMEDELRAGDEPIGLSADEKRELTRPTDPADRATFERKVDLVHRWIIHLELSGVKLEHLSNAAVTLSNRYFVAPAQAAVELDRVAGELARMEGH